MSSFMSTSSRNVAAWRSDSEAGMPAPQRNNSMAKFNRRATSLGPEVPHMPNRFSTTSSVWTLVPTPDDHRMQVPPLEQRVREAERALVRVCELGVKPVGQRHRPPPLPRSSLDVDPEENAQFAPLSIREPERMDSWKWLLSGRRSSLRFILDERVIKV